MNLLQAFIYSYLKEAIVVTPYTKVTFSNVVEVAELYAKESGTLASNRKIAFLDKATKCLTQTEQTLLEADSQRLNFAICTLIQGMVTDRVNLKDLARYLYHIEKRVGKPITALPASVQPVQIIEQGERHTILPQGELPSSAPKVVDLRKLSPQSAKAVLLFLQEDDLFVNSITRENLLELLQFSMEHNFRSLSLHCRTNVACPLLKDSFAGLSRDVPEELYQAFDKLKLQDTPPDALCDLYHCNQFAELTLDNFEAALKVAVSATGYENLRQKCVDFSLKEVAKLNPAKFATLLKNHLKEDFLIPVFQEYFQVQCKEAFRYSGGVLLVCFRRTLVIHEQAPELIPDLLNYVKDTLCMLPYFNAISFELPSPGQLWKALDIAIQYDCLKTVTIAFSRPQTPGLDLENDIVKNWRAKNLPKSEGVNIQIRHS